MKPKQKIDLLISLLLILLGSILLVLPIFEVKDIKTILIIVFSVYTILNLVQFILTKESKDIEGLLSSLASLITLIASVLVKVSSPRSLAMIIMTWVILMSLAKLKKTDYYHDRRDRMWKIRVLNLTLFILIGILTSINLAYSSDIQIMVLGFFLFTHGVLELFDPITKYLIAHS